MFCAKWFLNIGVLSGQCLVAESCSQARDLYFEVREFKRQNGFKYAWTNYGKPHLKKDDTSRSKSFTNLLEFEAFKADFFYPS